MVAQTFGVTRRGLYKFLDRHPELKETLDDARQSMLDNAESALYKAVLRGESWAVSFFLKTQGRTRGYIEASKLELEGKIETRVERRVGFDVDKV